MLLQCQQYYNSEFYYSDKHSKNSSTSSSCIVPQLLQAKIILLNSVFVVEHHFNIEFSFLKSGLPENTMGLYHYGVEAKEIINPIHPYSYTCEKKQKKKCNWVYFLKDVSCYRPLAEKERKIKLY